MLIRDSMISSQKFKANPFIITEVKEFSFSDIFSKSAYIFANAKINATVI